MEKKLCRRDQLKTDMVIYHMKISCLKPRKRRIHLKKNNGKTAKNAEKIARFIIVFFISIVVLLGVIERRSSLFELVQTLLSINIILFFLSNAPYFVQALIMGFRLKLCFEKVGTKITFKNAFFSHLAGMFFSDFSMGRTGYLAAALPIESNINLSLGVVSTTVAVDAIFKGVTGGICILIFSILFFRYEYTLMAIAVSTFMAGGGILFLLYVWKDVDLLERISVKIPIFGQRLALFLKEWRKSIKELESFRMRRKLGKRLRRIIESRYNYKTETKKLIKIYKDVI